MALVNLLRFSQKSGGMVADEEFWNIFFRRRLHGDNLHSLLTPDMAADWDMEVAVGTVGYPSVHHEALQAARAELARRHEMGRPLDGVREAARIVFEALRDAVRRRIDTKLRFFFGFETDDLVRGAVDHGDAETPIKNPKVRDLAMDMSQGKRKDKLLQQAFEVKAAVFGYDPLYGITAYHLSPDKWICGYVHEGFDCLGTGKYASGLMLGEDFNAKTLMMRKAGYEPAEGVFELLQSAYMAVDHFKEVGGTMHFVLIDHEDRTGQGRYREIFDDRAKLCGEIVRAAIGGFLDRHQAEALLDGLLFQNKPVAATETALLRAAGDGPSMRYFLRGYKRNEAPLCAASSAAGGARKAKKARGRR